jgi:hypothetical protein
MTDRTWLGLTVTGGLDKLPDPTGVITTTTTDEEGDPATVTITLTSTETVTNALPSETGSDGVSPPETTGSDKGGKDSGGGSSRAWVAGPVLGGLTGVLLVVFGCSGLGGVGAARNQRVQKSSVTPNTPTLRREVKRRSTSSKREVCRRWRQTKLRRPS